MNREFLGTKLRLAAPVLRQARKRKNLYPNKLRGMSEFALRRGQLAGDARIVLTGKIDRLGK